jgi:hypothetical protein
MSRPREIHVRSYRNKTARNCHSPREGEAIELARLEATKLKIAQNVINNE